MARITQPTFGTRQHKPKPRATEGHMRADTRRVDWTLVALAGVAFVVGFVWLF